jgi:hypothetical protein
MPATGAQNAGMSDGRRKALLEAGLMEVEARAAQAGQPFEVVTQGDFDVVYAVTQPPNHWLHKRLTIQTLGLWAPVWWFQSRRGKTRKVFHASVDPNGKVRVRRVRG